MQNRTMNTKREAYEIRGDGNRTSGVSTANAIDSALCHPIVLYRDRLLTVDVFQAGDEPPHVLIYCPFCTERDPYNKRNMSLTIRGKVKEIGVDPLAFPRIPGWSIDDLVQYLKLPNRDAARGVISIEKFRCSWEERPEENRGATGIVGGLTSAICDWQVSITNNVAKDEH